MAWSQSDIDKLKSAIAQGVREVQYSDASRVVYRSLKEMKETLAMMQAEVSSSTPRVKTVRFTTSKGL